MAGRDASIPRPTLARRWQMPSRKAGTVPWRAITAPRVVEVAVFAAPTTLAALVFPRIRLRYSGCGGRKYHCEYNGPVHQPLPRANREESEAKRVTSSQLG
jgi:hypothetical protein